MYFFISCSSPCYMRALWGFLWDVGNEFCTVQGQAVRNPPPMLGRRETEGRRISGGRLRPTTTLGDQWQKEAVCSGVDSLTATPHWPPQIR